MLSDSQRRNRLIKRVAEIRILVGAAVSRPPGCVDAQLHQVGQTPDLLRAGGLAAWQRTELIEIDGGSSFGFQIGVDEYLVGQFILSIVVYVLVHIFVENRER